MDKIIWFSIRNKLLVGILVSGLVAWGLFALSRLPIDAVPDITNNQVLVITSSPSNPAEDIEQFVTFPIEQAMASLPGREEIRSFSRFGLSVVTIVFSEETDTWKARQMVSERLALAREQIPPGMGSPALGPVSTGLGEIYQYVLFPRPGFEKQFDPGELRTLQDWVVRRHLLGVQGVADVSGFGGFVRQYEVALNPNRLRSAGIPTSAIRDALEASNRNSGGAYIERKPNAFFIRSKGRLDRVADLRNIPVGKSGSGMPVLLGQVAEIRTGSAIRYGALTRNEEGEAVGGVVLMQKGENSARVTEGVKARMAEIEKALPEGVGIRAYLDRSDLVNRAIATVRRNLIEGALIVILVLVFLLGNLRAGLLVASVIPLSLLFAFGMMYAFGVSGNLMSLGALDFGLVVDGAVILVEASLHHFAIRRLSPGLSPEGRDREVFESASRIRNSAAFGELIILMVYLPILALTGIEGKMFRPMAQTVSFALLGAFILSLTYVPMMSAWLLRPPGTTRPGFSDRIMAFFIARYLPVLDFVFRRQKAALAGVAALFGFALLLFFRMGSEFIPTLDEGDFAVEVRLLPGTSLSQTVETTTRASALLRKHFPEVRECIGKIGSAEIPTDPMPMEACDLMVLLKDKDEWTSASTREELADAMKEMLTRHIPGVEFGFQQPIQMRFNELMSGVKQDVSIRIYGENLDKLQEYARLVGRSVARTQGVCDLYVEPVGGLSQIMVEMDYAALSRHGIPAEEVNRSVRLAFAGEKVGEFFENEKRYDLVLRFDTAFRKGLPDIRDLPVFHDGGHAVPLSQLARISFQSRPNQIQRDDAKRRIGVAFNLRGRDVESVVQELRSRIPREVPMEPGYLMRFGGTFENLEAARARLQVAVPVALILIFLLLYLSFRSVSQALLIYSAIPLSAIGGVLALQVRGMPFSISAGVGFIALFGVAVLNGLVLISEFRHLKADYPDAVWQRIRKGCEHRFRPVLLTALVASLGFLPMALSTGSGAEVQKPLATVVIGGLFSATFLTLFVLPLLYHALETRSFRFPAAAAILPLLVCFVLPVRAQPLSLGEALRRADAGNPRLRLIREQAGLSAVQGNVVDVPRTTLNGMLGQYNSRHWADNNLTLSQAHPFPTLPSAQRKLGRLQTERIREEEGVTRAEVQTAIRLVYLLAQVDEGRLALLLRTDSLVSQMADKARLRVKAGQAPPSEEDAFRLQSLEVNQETGRLRAGQMARGWELAGLLGEAAPATISGSPYGNPLPPSDSLSRPAFDSMSVLAPLFRMRQKEWEQSLRVEKARQLPDFFLGYFNQTLIGPQDINGRSVYFGSGKRFQGVQAGLSFPLLYRTGRFQLETVRRSGKVLEAEKNLRQSEWNAALAQARLLQQQAYRSWNSLQTETLPLARQNLLRLRLAYEKGAVSYAEYLLQLRQLLSLENRILEAFLEYHRQTITINSLLKP